MLDGTFFDNSIEKRNMGIDLLKVYSIIMVVLTHCYAPSLLQSLFGELWIYNAVPFFLIIAAFLYARKYNKTLENVFSLRSAYRGWLCKRNLFAYFKRITVPYLFFMLLQIIVLPIVKYASFDIALLNTIKGGMGPGGYYLVVYLQLFLMIPFLNTLYKKNPILMFGVCFAAQYAWDLILHYLLLDINPPLITDINKFLAFRFLILFAFGTALYYEFNHIRLRQMFACIFMGAVIVVARNYIGYAGIFPIDDLFSIIQTACWCFGLAGIVILQTKNFAADCKALTLMSESTLHILLFQQLYFCCVGVERHKAYIDAPVALIGGLLVFLGIRYLKVFIRKCRNNSMISKKSSVE